MENSPQTEIQIRCIDCGKNTSVKMSQSTYNDPMLRGALENAAQCANCIAAEKAADRQYEKNQRITEQEYENERTYDARLKASRLNFYRLAYDPQDPRANPELFEWVGQRTDKCILLNDESGICKSRIMQHYAYQLLKEGKNILYITAADMLNEIIDAFHHKKQGRRFLAELKAYDLIIIDDLCKFNETTAKIIYFWQVFDRRYIRHDQELKLNSGEWNPMYWSDEDRKDGWQIWLGTNCNADQIAEKFDKYSPNTGDPIVRRITDMFEIWKADTSAA